MQLREGARYRCFGDGLCCTDLHAVGPITRAEARRLDVAHPGLVRRNAALKSLVVVAIEGRCAHLDVDGVPGVVGGCRVHALPKPAVCTRFPYRSIAIPGGVRIATEHRCPCRTMGDRPLLDLGDARASVKGSFDVRVERVEIAPGKSESFDAYQAVEGPLLRRLLGGDDPLVALEAAPFPPLETATWTDVAHHYRSKLDGSACGEALAWFGDMILARDGTRVRDRRRPWQAAFDRAEARSKPGNPEVVIADWVADELWGLEWTTRGSLLHARHDLATRVDIVREIARRGIAAGLRPDRAAAEAVMIGEMAGAAPLFASVVRAFVTTG